MELKSFDQLSSLEIDTLREIGSIGTGNAATALSQTHLHQGGFPQLVELVVVLNRIAQHLLQHQIDEAQLLHGEHQAAHLAAHSPAACSSLLIWDL